MDAVFSVGYKGNLEDLKNVLAASAKVKCVYTGGISGGIGGGRPQYLKSMAELEEQVRYAHSKNVRFEVALNAPVKPNNCPDSHWRQKAVSSLVELEKAGVDGVIVAHPVVMDMVKVHTGMSLIISTICEITTARSALRHEAIGGDVIVPSMNANMNMPELELMARSLKKAKLRIMVNEMCMGDCPWRRSHFNETAWNHERHGITADFYYLNCSRMYLKEPHLLVSNNTIRPEDLKHYQHITDEFKIVGRNASIDDLILRITAYDREKFDGNYVRLLWSDLARELDIPNRLLDGIIEDKRKCPKVCDACNRCRKRLVQAGTT